VLDMTTSAQEDLNNTKLRGESAIQPRTEQMVYPVGFSLLKKLFFIEYFYGRPIQIFFLFSIVVQFKPAVPITAIAWDSTLGLLAAGNEFGYAICSLPKREVLLVRALLSAMGLPQGFDDSFTVCNMELKMLSKFPTRTAHCHASKVSRSRSVNHSEERSGKTRMRILFLRKQYDNLSDFEEMSAKLHPGKLIQTLLVNEI
jgi:hypothetical protein